MKMLLQTFSSLLESLRFLFNPAELALVPARHTILGTSGGGAFKRVSVAWLLKFYFKE